MAVADVMHVVAVEIHVAPAGGILDANAFGLDDGIEARRRDGLPEEIALVLGQKRARGGVEIAPRPGAALRRKIGVALRLLRSFRHGPLHQRRRQACRRMNTRRSRNTCRSFAAKAVITIRVAIAAAPAVTPASSICTIATEASLVPGP